MNAYELISVFDPLLGEEKIKETLSKIENKIKSLGGEMVGTEPWGNRKLACTFKKAKKLQQGYYLLMKFKGPSPLPQLLTNYLKFTENVVRYNICRAEEILEIASPKETEEKIFFGES